MRVSNEILANPPVRVLRLFAVYGYSKTSMLQIAATLGVSRQAVYNRFKSKSACYQWAIEQYLADKYFQAFSMLQQAQGCALELLNDIFYVLIIDAVDLVKCQFGKQVFEDVLKVTQSSQGDWSLRFRGRLADFLCACQLAESEREGSNKAFVLVTAAKGLLLESSSKRQASQDMATVLTTVLNPLGVSSID